ncbi:hypothetical protein F441_13661 [Phytophthora nicotianae CJ01A1]|uniref:Uncharacterized protein n=4 Tax=Phytophthora nicotianae TaxID=4792 RepID=W2R5S5_PHYN3|nr:hypothetical protein PPTG_21363 [Phytophthora nicotianae INRA-310]ETI40996.1 hypothetical protein F443_13736 [Phytophthora nicotianae P1569]ETK81073.1 hypothetical protein L915_13391 [Phytophthora nicotianae]ETP10750.1 hypothetical protein F441_13661 [Phytophthora nicotianae CJ01A1]ETL34491.1 hypothetical protein L916_13278 [Phytophthora nicotianae]ETM40989.1 hypothetical protein L914_13186 [Phytophthora nicotianae]
MDRSSLAQRRKQIREKENDISKTNSSEKAIKKNKIVKGKETTRSIANKDPPSATTLRKGEYEPQSVVPSNTNSPQAPFPSPLKGNFSSKPVKVTTAYNPEINAELVVHKLLQRSQFRDVEEYLQSVTKPDLFQQALVVATHVQELKKKHAEDLETLDQELDQYQEKYRSVTSNLAERKQIYEEQEKEKTELCERLERAKEEIQSLVSTIREHKNKFKSLEQTKQEQVQIIEEMSEIRRRQEEQLNVVEKENEQVLRFAKELQEQHTKLQAQMTMIERDCKRFEAELQEEQETNSKLTVKIEQKDQILEWMSSELEDARTQMSTLQGQIQLETISRHSVTQERDRLQQQYQMDRQDWKSTQEHRYTLEKRKADEFRKMDLELRRLSQALSRMRIEWESEKSQREKSEDRLQELEIFFDETKVHTQAMEEEVQQLKAQLNGVK